jgi:uncharacterized protein YndB with AHSA1/START domain
MSSIHITREYPHSPANVWRAVTDPELIPLWTATGQGGRPEGFSTEVGTHFRFVGKPLPGWDGIVECEVLEAREPSLLRYSWSSSDGGDVTVVAYRLDPHGAGTRFTYEHTGFAGIGGFLLAKVVLGPVRRKMFGKGLARVLDELDNERQLRATSTPSRDRRLIGPTS